ncbi:MAG: FAD/NAD(P)-binding oxidoreductase [Thermaerobacter sp.]|nr:FAD/NAD(P)-binding oxidoreductase [Thermaerobacter sp.]
MSKKLLIIGSGTAGLMVANLVARQLRGPVAHRDIEVTVLGERDEYVYQPGFLYVAFDLWEPDSLRRKVADLLSPGVRFVHDRAERIDAAAQSVTTRTGQTLQYDYLVIATGSQLNLTEIPGLEEGAHWFYTLEGALRLREALKSFEGGRLVLSVGIPHKCPVAPVEFTMMFDDWARARGIREKTEITYTYPVARPHTIASVADFADREFTARGIEIETFFNMDSIDAQGKVLHSQEGTDVPYDLLVAIPPHMGDTLGAASGLAEKGNWYPTDRNLLRVGAYKNIFAVGDTTNIPVSKAGSVAHFESEVLADNLVGLLTDGREPGHAYTGRAFCFIETGLEQATYISFDFAHPPTVPTPSRSIHLFKQTYNRIHWANLKAVM